MENELQAQKKKPNMFNLLRPYVWSIAGLMLLAIAANALGLILPKIISRGIDAYVNHIFLQVRLFLNTEE